MCLGMTDVPYSQPVTFNDILRVKAAVQVFLHMPLFISVLEGHTALGADKLWSM